MYIIVQYSTSFSLLMLQRDRDEGNEQSLVQLGLESLTVWSPEAVLEQTVCSSTGEGRLSALECSKKIAPEVWVHANHAQCDPYDMNLQHMFMHHWS